MEVKYQLGRSHFRTYYEGIEKEWLLTNGIGGFANQTVIGANSRIYSGYLVASLKPPVDRMMIFSNTHEAVRLQGQEYDLTAQEYINEFKEGFRYLNRFELDVLPTYTYQVKDLVVKKSVSLEYGKNTSVVCYEIENGMEEAELIVTPLFTYRSFGSTAERAELRFDKAFKKADDNRDYLELIPEANRVFEKIIILSTGGFNDATRYPLYILL
ncbi:MAG TPA: glycogen debranching enzyme N-terminal domain-containing protein, partial [Lachnospiraceae bacterium]|nr:glycogen debranching enzyme N-terminal domain-containing protein [Lachnospiraceae bacterium]